LSTTVTSVLDWTVTSNLITSIGYNGQDGTPGVSGPRNSFIYFYYNVAQATAPSAPPTNQISYSFLTNSASVSAAGWSTTFDPSALSAVSGDNKYWAISVIFSEITYGGAQNTPVITGPFTWTNFNGLVTFTNLSAGKNANGVVTSYIDGGTITTNTLLVDSIKNNTSGTFNTYGTFGLGTNSTIGPFQGAGAFSSSTNSLFGILASNTNGGNGIGAGTTAASASFTGELSTGAGAAINGSISGTTLTVTSVSFGTIVPGFTVFGSGVAANTVVTGYISGTGGVGTYSVNITQNVATTFMIVAGGYLYVTAVASGTIVTGTSVFGSGVAAGTYITSFSSGTAGGVGTYTVNISQNVSSRPMTAGGGGAGLAAVGSANSNFTTWKNQGTIGNSDSGGAFATAGSSNMQTTTTADIRLAYYTGGTSYSTYVYSGAAYPFTAGHDAFQLLTEDVPEIGDLMVDVALIAAPNVSDCITQMTVSTATNQKGVIGVYTGETGVGFVPASLGEYVESIDGTKNQIQLKSEFEDIYNTYRCIGVNAIGEGKINVCGQGGNIEIGDLICASNMAGKGMKQGDDLYHLYTVAKARQAVTFTSPEQVVQIACIYVAG
jgi:hypothetical protein